MATLERTNSHAGIYEPASSRILTAEPTTPPVATPKPMSAPVVPPKLTSAPSNTLEMGIPQLSISSVSTTEPTTPNGWKIRAD